MEAHLHLEKVSALQRRIKLQIYITHFKTRDAADFYFWHSVKYRFWIWQLDIRLEKMPNIQLCCLVFL